MASYVNVGAQFADFNSLEHCIREYEKENHVNFFKRESRTIQTSSRKISHVRTLSDESIKMLKYYRILYTCVYGGRVHIAKPIFRHRKKPSIRMNCPAYIRVGLCPNQNCLTIIEMNTEHNHDISEELFKKMPQQRKLAKEEREKVEKLLSLKVDTKLLLEKIKEETGKELTRKDLHNISTVRKTRVKQSKEHLIANKPTEKNYAEINSIIPAAPSTILTLNAAIAEATEGFECITEGATLPELGATQKENHISEETTMLGLEDTQSEDDISEEPPLPEFEMIGHLISNRTQTSEQMSNLEFYKKMETRKLKIEEQKLKLKARKNLILEEQNKLLKQIIAKM